MDKDRFKIKKRGEPFKFESPDHMIEVFNAYIDHIWEDKIEEEQLFHYQGEVVKGKAAKEVPLSKVSFCHFAGITERGFLNYKTREGYEEAYHLVEAAIRSYQTEGGLSNKLNPQFVARINGIVDHKDITSGGKPITYSEEQRNSRIEELIKKASL